MKAEYSRDLYHNYMILQENEHSREDAYCIKMLEAEGLEGVLRPECRSINNSVLYYYDITAKQSLINLLTGSALTCDRVKQLITGIIRIIGKAYEYLLNEKDFIISPEMVFLDLNTGDVRLCYYPGYQRELNEQMSGFIEYMMNKVDYSDKEAVLLIYNLYAACRKEGFTFDLLIEILKAQNQPQPIMRRMQRRNSFQEEESKADKVSMSLPPEGPAEDSKAIFPAIRNRFRQTEKEDNRSLSIMTEKETVEEELSCYPIKTYMYTAGCCLAAVLVLIFCMKTKLCLNSFGNKVDYMKLFAVLLILLCGCGYAVMKLWDKNNRITKLVTKQEYYAPDRKERPIPGESKEEGLLNTVHEKQEEDVNPTCLLNAAEPGEYGTLKPMEEFGYEPIKITKSPFTIGKLRKNVDYCLEKEVISRYHAKITKEKNQYYLTDLNSTNGTFLNKEALTTYQQREIKAGDEISFANIKYQFIVQGHPQ